MKIKTQKRDRCPICSRQIVRPNCWVRYHVRYGAKPIEILACRYCNFAEYALRTGNPVGGATFGRLSSVIAFQKKFGIVL